jgi:carbonic anhydrase
MPDELLERLRKFRTEYFPAHRQEFTSLIQNGQTPKTLFLGCSDSRIVPYLLTGTGPGDLFILRNVGAIVPPYDGSYGIHGTAAGIEFAVLQLKVDRIVVCGHSHCGAVKSAYEGVPDNAINLKAWLSLIDEALLPVCQTSEALRRVEQRSIVLQLERLMDYPMVRAAVEQKNLTLHGWYYVIEDGEVHVFDVAKGQFISSHIADSCGTGPYLKHDDCDCG